MKPTDNISTVAPAKGKPEALLCTRCHTTLYLYPGARRMRATFLKTHATCAAPVPSKTDPLTIFNSIWSK